MEIDSEERKDLLTDLIDVIKVNIVMQLSHHENKLLLPMLAQLQSMNNFYKYLFENINRREF